MECTCNCFLPLGVCKDELKASYGQWQLDMRVDFARNSHHLRWFFDGSLVKPMHKMAWFIGAWATLVEHDSLFGKNLEEMCWLVLDSSNYSMVLLFFLLAKCHILEIWYTVMESFVVRRPSFVATSSFTGLGNSDTVTHVSLLDLLMFDLNMFDSEEGLQVEETRHFFNPIIK